MQKKLAIAEYLLERMQSGAVGPDGKLPSQTVLMRHFGCSRTTVVHAVEALRRQGYVTGRQGSGLFANTPPRGRRIERLLVINSFANFPNSDYAILVQHLEGDFLSVDYIGRWQVSERSDLLTRPNQAVIWMLPPETMLSHMEYLRKLGTPQLLVNRDYAGFDCIWTDAAESLVEGLSWLLIEGGRDIAFITPPPDRMRPYLPGRVIAFYETCLALHAKLSPELIFKFNLNDNITEIDNATRAIFNLPNPPRSIFCMDFEYVVPFVICATKYGKELGRDYYLLCFDPVPSLEGKQGIAIMEQPLHLFRLEIENWLRTAGHESMPPFRRQLKCILRTPPAT